MSFLIKSSKFLEKYKNIWEKVSNNIKKEKRGSQCICWSVILIDSIFRTGNNYYSQVFLEKCKYVVKEKSMLE